MVHLDATLDHEAGAIVRQAIREHLDGAARAGTDARTPAQRRVDALVAVAQASLGVDDVGAGRRRNKVIVTVAWERPHREHRWRAGHHSRRIVPGVV